MRTPLSRRDFLKMSLLAAGSLGSLAFNPFPGQNDDLAYPGGVVGRIAATNKVTVYKEPDWDSPVVGYLNKKDQLIQIYSELTPPKGPKYNPLWYRVWGGYVHSAYIQQVKFRFNDRLDDFPKTGQLFEVTVPYTTVYQYNVYEGWVRYFRLYYETTHWVVGVEKGPDDKLWYKIDDRGVFYLAPAEHFRLVPDSEMEPISPDVPWEDKRLEVSIQEQMLTAFEDNKPVFSSKVSTGINIRPDPNGIPWNTPRGTYNIASKTPSTHMGQGRLTGDPEAYELLGVPWTLYFVNDIGIAFHGAYWHNNFGLQMSHGCVNMRPHEAQWLFRWTYPVFKLPITELSGRDKRGHGTRVDVI